MKTTVPVESGPIVFVSKSKGFAGGDAGLFKTDNGGKTWTPFVQDLTAGFTVQNIVFSNTKSGIVLLRCPFVEPCNRRSKIISTNDGGDIWHTVFSREGMFFSDIKSSDGVFWLIGDQIVRYDSDQDKTTLGPSLPVEPNDSRQSDYPRVIIDLNESQVTYLTDKGDIHKSTLFGENVTGKVNSVSLGSDHFLTGGITDNKKIWYLWGEPSRFHSNKSELFLDGKVISSSLNGAVISKAIYLGGGTFIVSGERTSARVSSTDETKERSNVIWETDNFGENWREVCNFPGSESVVFLSQVVSAPTTIVALSSVGQVTILEPSR